MARHCRMPLCIMACGAVPKATAPFYRLITDCRPINQFADPWRVKYIFLSGLSLLLSPGCVFWVIDLTAAYHATPLGGCGRPYIAITRWIRSQSGTGPDGLGANEDTSVRVYSGNMQRVLRQGVHGYHDQRTLLLFRRVSVRAPNKQWPIGSTH